MNWIVLICLAVICAVCDLRLRRRIAKLKAENEILMLRSVAAMAIAENEPGWEKLPIDCPMLREVKKLRLQHDRHERHVNFRRNIHH